MSRRTASIGGNQDKRTNGADNVNFLLIRHTSLGNQHKRENQADNTITTTNKQTAIIQ